MRKVYLEGILGQKYGEEWTLNVASPAEALTAIMAQRPGMKQFLAQSEGIQGYEVLINDESITSEAELVLNEPGMTQTYTFVPVVAGSKSKVMMMVLGVTLIAVTGGFGAAFAPGFMGAAGAAGTGTAMAGATTAAAAQAAAIAGGATGVLGAQAGMAAGMSMGAAAAAAGTSTTAILATQAAGYLGVGLLLSGVASMLMPEPPEGSGAESAQNYLFSGPVNNVKQGGPVPLVYGRAIVGSTTISGSVYSTTSREKVSSTRALVGISNFRQGGSTFGQNENTGQNQQVPVTPPGTVIP